MGGLNIRIPTTSAVTAYNASRAATQILSDYIKGYLPFSIADHDSIVTHTQSQFSRSKRDLDSQQLSAILERFDPSHWRSLLRHQRSLSGWLTVLPVQKDHFNSLQSSFGMPSV